MQHTKQGAVIVVSSKLEVVFAQVNPQILQIPQFSNHSNSLFLPLKILDREKWLQFWPRQDEAGKYTIEKSER